MDGSGLTLQPVDAEADALAYVEELLDTNDLPSADVRSGSARFYVAVDDGRVGVSGLELHGSVGLLRSVVVEASARGEGYGTVLCRGTEALARDEGVEDLYLLTTTAADFFAERGYVETAREDAPAAIRATSQFEELCPSSAVCMRTSL